MTHPKDKDSKRESLRVRYEKQRKSDPGNFLLDFDDDECTDVIDLALEDLEKARDPQERRAKLAALHRTSQELRDAVKNGQR